MMRWLRDRFFNSITWPASAQLELSEGKKILFVVHGPIDSPNAGGTEIVVRNMIKGMSSEYTPYVLFPVRRSIFLEVWSPVRRTIHEFKKMPIDAYVLKNEKVEERFSQILDVFNFDVIHFHHLLRFPLSLVEIAKGKMKKIVMTCHDSYYLCIQHRLLENGEVYCDGCVDLDRCDSCLKNQFNIPPGFQQKWREYCKTILNLSDSIVMDTQVTLDIYTKVLGIDRSRVRIIEPAIESPKLTRPGDASPDAEGIIKIAFVGYVSDRVKGREMIIDLVKSDKQDKIEWHFFGAGSKIRKLSRFRNVVNHDESGSLPRALIDSGIHIVVLPYIGFEGYSLALSNTWAAGLPVIVPDMAALGRRVREQQGGWTYPPAASTGDILALIERIRKDRTEYERVTTTVRNIPIRSIPEYCNDYERLYRELTESSGQHGEKKLTEQSLRIQTSTDSI